MVAFFLVILATSLVIPATSLVIPAKAGIHIINALMDSRFRGNDMEVVKLSGKTMSHSDDGKTRNKARELADRLQAERLKRGDDFTG